MTVTAMQKLAAVLAGLLVGTGGFTFLYARGFSYLSDKPETCVNCHVMREQLDAWYASSHSSAAVCNDCHTPHPKVAKYLVKATNGIKHSTYFTLGNFHEPIRISSSNRRIVEQNCRRCHEHLVGAIHGSPDELSCLSCHVRAGHQR